MNRLSLPVSIGLTAICVAIGVFGVGCGIQQRAAEGLIDPRLRSEGVLVERQESRGDLELGPYRVEDLELRDEAFDYALEGRGSLAPDAAGRTRPTQQLRLSFTLAGGARAWAAECVGQRRQPPDHDLAAVADEVRDEVAVDCQISGQADAQLGREIDAQLEQLGARWILHIDGALGDNLVGRLAPARGPQGESSGEGRSDSAGKVVEIVMWHRLLNFTRRRLPASLALIRAGAGGEVQTEAALILDSPERAWLDPSLDEAERELALTAMLALRLLPLGFDG